MKERKKIEGRKWDHWPTTTTTTIEPGTGKKEKVGKKIHEGKIWANKKGMKGEGGGKII